MADFTLFGITQNALRELYHSVKHEATRAKKLERTMNESSLQAPNFVLECLDAMCRKSHSLA